MSTQATDGYLSNHPFFSGLDSRFFKYLSDKATELPVAEGEVLFRQGERAEKFYLLREGEIRVQIPALMGPALEIQSLMEGQLLGWSWLVPPYRWNFLAVAGVDSELLEFDGAAILKHCEEDPEFGYAILKRFAALMSERLDAARQKMMEQWDPPGFA